MSYKLVDGIKQNKLHPDTFEIPTKKEIGEVKLGQYVKLGFIEEGSPPERMWVMVDSIKGDKFRGFLNNNPFIISSIKCGDVVVFESKHILSIFE